MNVKWETPLIEATILKRYKRFLADIKLGDEILTIHVPNTGSMTSCWAPEWKCAISLSKNPDRKMPYTLEYTHNGESWIGVNTGNANKLAKTWLEQNLIPELSGYQKVTPEKKIGESRIDFFLEEHTNHPSCYVEVKSVTLKDEGSAKFPDAVSERGQKHLIELMELKKKGHRAVMLYIIQREDVNQMRPASAIDPKYTKLLKEAMSAGVEILVYQCRLDLSGISLKGSLPFFLGPQC
jgi:sugar fermentation stimulation protein A